jgi:hypothetical protein
MLTVTAMRFVILAVLLISLRAPLFAQEACPEQDEEVAAEERGDRQWLIDHLVIKHQIPLDEATAFVNQYVDDVAEKIYEREVRAAAAITAERHLAEGNCYFLVAGAEALSEQTYVTIRESGAEPLFFAACMMTKEESAFLDGYNGVMLSEFRKRWGMEIRVHPESDWSRPSY